MITVTSSVKGKMTDNFKRMLITNCNVAFFSMFIPLNMNVTDFQKSRFINSWNSNHCIRHTDFQLSQLISNNSMADDELWPSSTCIVLSMNAIMFILCLLFYTSQKKGDYLGQNKL